MRISWQWLGGFFDGEGTVWLDNQRATIVPGCRISQCEDNNGNELMEAIKNMLDTYGITCSTYPSANYKSEQLQYNLTVTGRDNVHKFLYILMPFIVIKRGMIEDILRLLKVFPKLPDKARSLLVREGKEGQPAMGGRKASARASHIYGHRRIRRPS